MTYKQTNTLGLCLHFIFRVNHLFFFLAALQSMQDLSFPIRARTHAPYSGKAWSLNHWTTMEMPLANHLYVFCRVSSTVDSIWGENVLTSDVWAMLSSWARGPHSRDVDPGKEEGRGLPCGPGLWRTAAACLQNIPWEICLDSSGGGFPEGL